MASCAVFHSVAFHRRTKKLFCQNPRLTESDIPLIMCVMSAPHYQVAAPDLPSNQRVFLVNARRADIWKKTFSGFLCVLTSMFLCSCTTTSKFGKEFDTAVTPKFKVGETSAEEVIQLFGTPWSVCETESIRSGCVKRTVSYTYLYGTIVTKRKNNVNWSNLLLAILMAANTQPVYGALTGNTTAKGIDPTVANRLPDSSPPDSQNISVSTESKSLEIEFDEDGIIKKVRFGSYSSSL